MRNRILTLKEKEFDNAKFSFLVIIFIAFVLAQIIGQPFMGVILGLASMCIWLKYVVGFDIETDRKKSASAKH